MSTEKGNDKYGSLRGEIPKPEIEKPPEECSKCDTAIVMGLLTGECEMKPEEEKDSCWEKHVKYTEDKGAVDSLTDAFVEEGSENMDRMVDRANWIIYQASVKAKEKLMEEGKLPKPQQQQQQEQQSKNR